jgi:hypothetical protein
MTAFQNIDCTQCQLLSSMILIKCYRVVLNLKLGISFFLLAFYTICRHISSKFHRCYRLVSGLNHGGKSVSEVRLEEKKIRSKKFAKNCHEPLFRRLVGFYVSIFVRKNLFHGG